MAERVWGNTLRICVNEVRAGQIRGELRKEGESGVKSFGDMAEMLLQGDRMLDRVGKPQASTEGRHFGNEKAREKEEEKMSVEKAAETGEKATFVVQIKYRQHATWQGQVKWAEKNETKSFRSALELIKLIDSALAESDIEPV